MPLSLANLTSSTEGPLAAMSAVLGLEVKAAAPVAIVEAGQALTGDAPAQTAARAPAAPKFVN